MNIESASSTQQQQEQQQPSPPPPSQSSLAFTTTKIPITEKINEHVSHPSNANTIAASTALQQPDADEKCSRGNGDASPQASDEGSAKNKSKELIPADSLKKDIIIPKESEGTLISVNLEEGNIPDAMLKELIPQPDNNIKQEQIPKLKDVFELEASAFGAVSTEPAIKPKCSFNRVSFSRSHTVYFLPNTKQRLHKKVVRSRHDAWRRYGALMVIHKRGGWSYTMNGKAKNFQKVDKDTPLPPAPVLPPILTEEEFHKRPIITIATSSSKSKRQRQEKKESKGDTDTSVSEEEPPSC
uniref:Uncharacterized protein n=2 Tax=Panagrolaimus sp. ES5 TaxID=591445 RepID=A0AC34FWQ5_9BILA